MGESTTIDEGPTEEREPESQSPFDAYCEHAKKLIELAHTLKKTRKQYAKIVGAASGDSLSGNIIEVQSSPDASLSLSDIQTINQYSDDDEGGECDGFIQVRTVTARFETNGAVHCIDTKSEQGIIECRATRERLRETGLDYSLSYQCLGDQILTSDEALIQRDLEGDSRELDFALLDASLKVLQRIQKIMSNEVDHRNTVIDANTWLSSLRRALQPFLNLVFAKRPPISRGDI